ncbi:hypothetical protein [Glutamicibacter protophormiae]|uniref:hypothetical protein n=1 Tax=Glutamicibacter protophormiae TaxID=37930 RepID=UPI00195718BA|nr:hypothetical protein [Glutamicibacter protophormiae]QRQ78693.1 hypothetical protein JQN66_17725 [Glutamicibacter protophormiae]
MSQPIDVGSVLSGRYQVTETVLSSAEGDLVLSGIDQVLNRAVSIMVASVHNSSQLATSAREIAMGERTSNVQVLDLGITDSNQTYLVANVARSSDMLDLVLETDEAPYVEPFFTDTLGTEIFGESRQSVPETYADDDEYYENLRYEDASEQQGKVGTALSNGFAGFKNRFGKKNQQQSAEDVYDDSGYQEDDGQQYAAPADIDDQTAPNVQVTPTAATPVAPAQPEAPKPKVTRLDDKVEPNVTATAALAAAAQSKGQAPKAKPEESRPQQQKQQPQAQQPKPAATSSDAKKKAAAAAAGVAAGAASAAAPKASTFPAAAKNAPVQNQAVEQVDEEESTSRGTRLLVGAVLVIVLVIGVVFAFNFLGGDKDNQADDNGAPTVNEAPTTPGESNTPEESETPSLPAPAVADVSRLVPGNQELNSATDDTLSKMTDGNASSSYKSFSYTTGNFGGFASNMVFILELEEKSAVSEISLDGLNATGGAYEILVGSSDDLGSATSVAKGSFSGPSVTVPVKDGDKDFMEGQYIFLNVTDLPRRASGANPDRPYGLQIGEFSAK